ncbi:MAG: TIGR00730 family Rossman fold protein [Planctomycetaceae bacterium]|nr:TIGR00730 family Rossman fold protein [Planctomycetaceae bacterium]
MPENEAFAHRRICVFCGSSLGVDPAYREAAAHLGRAIAERGNTVIYGGGRVGLMGVVADAALSSHGTVIGVIPEFLSTKEIAHEGVTEMHTVPSMHVRKAYMAERADAFLALPGGLGTYDEFCEIVTWAQLGLHSKPIGLLNLKGFFDGLILQIERAVAEGFCRPEHRELFLVDDNPDRLLAAIESFEAPKVAKWLKPGQT